MQIHNSIVVCKSTPDNWKAEKINTRIQGTKRNTVRFVNSCEHKDLLDSKLKYIQIINTETGESFMRILTDYRPFEYEPGRFIWIFSW